jgi:hypothetical protein
MLIRNFTIFTFYLSSLISHFSEFPDFFRVEFTKRADGNAVIFDVSD